MRQLFKGLALLIAIVCLVWVGVLWHWQATKRDMSTQDVVLYLGVLPLVVYALVLLARWALRGAKRSDAARRSSAQTAANASAISPGAGGTPTARPSADQQERHATVQLIASGICCAAGRSCADLHSAVQDGSPRPEPDPACLDSEGLPVIVARVADLPLEDSAQALDDALAKAQEAAASSQAAVSAIDPAVRRALTALTAPLQETLQGLTAWRSAFTPPEEDSSGHIAKPNSDNRALIRLLPAWPAHWSPFERLLAKTWLQQHTQALVDTALPGARLHLMPPADPHGPGLWAEADRILVALAREQRRDVLVVLACMSDLSEARIEQLESTRNLFSTQHPKAAIPAEAAAVLALAPATWPAPDEPTNQPPAHLHRAAIVARDKSIDAPGRVSPTAAQEALTQALTAAGVAAAETAAIVSDADQHTARASELFSTMLAHLPHLDASQDAVITGPQLGRISPVAPLITVALAACRAQREEAPCVALSVDDDLIRLALVARPTSPSNARIASPTPTAP